MYKYLLKHRLWVGFYLFITGIYLLTASGRLGTSDGLAMFNVARSMLHGSLVAEPCQPAPKSNHCVPGVDGHYYAGFGLVPSAFVTPAVWLGANVSSIFHQDADVVSKTFVSLLTVIISPLVCVFLAMWIRNMGHKRITGIACATVLAFATPFWYHATKGFYSEPYFALFLVASAYALSLQRSWAPALAGALFGLAAGSRIFGVILWPAFAGYLCILASARGQRWLRDLLGFSSTFGVCLLFVAATNYLRFGDPLKTGYHLAYPTLGILLGNSFTEGCFHLLFNREAGLLWFAPWVVLSPLAFPAFAKKNPAEAVLGAGVFVMTFAFFAKYSAWHGGWAYGPRLLVPTLPFLAVSLAPLFEAYFIRSTVTSQLRRKMATGLLLCTSIVSVAIQVVGIPYPIARYYSLQLFHQRDPDAHWWSGSVLRASISFLPQLVSEIRAKKDEAMPPDGNDPAEAEFLRSFENPENLNMPDLLIVKIRLLGFRAIVTWLYITGTLSLALFGVGMMRKAS